MFLRSRVFRAGRQGQKETRHPNTNDRQGQEGTKGRQGQKETRRPNTKGRQGQEGPKGKQGQQGTPQNPDKVRKKPAVPASKADRVRTATGAAWSPYKVKERPCLQNPSPNPKVLTPNPVQCSTPIRFG